MRSQGRGYKFTVKLGENHPRAKPTDAEAAEMRQRYAAGGISQEELGRLYGIG
jgi:uncharacterized membrane protein